MKIWLIQIKKVKFKPQKKCFLVKKRDICGGKMKNDAKILHEKLGESNSRKKLYCKVYS